MTDSDDGPEAVQALVSNLHGHLEATAHLPVEASASRWLGEAEAVAEDAVRAARSAAENASGDEPRAGSDVPQAVVERRVEQVEMLLSNVEGTGNEEADEHVTAARELVAEIERRL